MSSPPPPPPPCSSGKGDRPNPAYNGSTLTTAAEAGDARTLLSIDDFMTVTATLAERQPDISWTTAERILTEALKFVAAGATGADDLVPSPIVDAGWHALIEWTAIYQELCARLGRFVHHYPAIPGARQPARGWRARTTAAIERAGYTLDQELWT